MSVIPCGDGWVIPEHLQEACERAMKESVSHGQAVPCVVIPGADIYAVSVLRGVLTEDEATAFRERDSFYDILVQRGKSLEN
jgi:hypothetical protein